MDNKMKYSKTLSHRIMYSCEEATYQISNSFHKKLSFIERQKLKLHLALCKPCKDYKKATASINKATKKLIYRANNKPQFKLSNDKREHIRKVIIGHNSE